MAGKLNLIFSHNFEYNIWKYLFDESEHIIVFELREEKSDAYAFVYTDILTDKHTTISHSELDWWTTIYDITNDEILFKKYDSGPNPVIKNIIQFSIQNNSVKQLSPDINLATPKNRNTSPSLYTIESDHYQLISTFVKSIINKQPNKRGIEYLEWNDLICLSFYIGEDKMANFLLIVNSKKEVVLHECIGNNLEGIGQDTFSIENNKLIFVKHNSEIFIYQYE